MTDTRTRRDVENEFYKTALASAGGGYASTGYGMPINQKMRFDLFTKEVIVPYGAQRSLYGLLDVGSGTGDLFLHLDGLDCQPGHYVGLDVMPEMTHRAMERLGPVPTPHDRTITLLTSDVGDYHYHRPKMTFDHVVSIAAYALKAPKESQQESIELVQQDIETMVEMAKKTVFVTLFSTWKTEIIPEEMVLDPVTMFAWAKSQWERVDLFHSYAPFDFTLLIHLEPSEWRREWMSRTLRTQG